MVAAEQGASPRGVLGHSAWWSDSSSGLGLYQESSLGLARRLCLQEPSCSDATGHLQPLRVQAHFPVGPQSRVSLCELSKSLRFRGPQFPLRRAQGYCRVCAAAAQGKLVHPAGDASSSEGTLPLC